MTSSNSAILANMQYEFSVGAFFIGIIVLGIGIAFVKWHQKVADSFGSGVVSYDRYKLYALITCGFGLLLLLNLPAFILELVLGNIFGS